MSRHTLNGTLQHYGVRGMKWGQRKAGGAVSSAKAQLDPVASAARARRIAIGKDISKGILIGGASLTVTALTGQRLAGAGTSLAISATLQAVNASKARGEQVSNQLMNKKF